MKKSNFSIRAIENMARIAAKEAEIRKAMKLPENKNSRKKSHKSRKSRFEMQIVAFRKAMASALAADEYRIVCENDCRSDGKAVIKVYKVADIERQQAELGEYRAQLSRGRAKSELPRPYQAQFTAMYVLYQGTIGEDKLESIAVYGEGATQTCSAITKSGVIFGFPVRYAIIEMGRRPFVDVYLKPNRA